MTKKKNRNNILIQALKTSASITIQSQWLEIAALFSISYEKWAFKLNNLMTQQF